jgi:hypothetical protein
MLLWEAYYVRVLQRSTFITLRHSCKFIFEIAVHVLQLSKDSCDIDFLPHKSKLFDFKFYSFLCENSTLKQNTFQSSMVLYLHVHLCNAGKYVYVLKLRAFEIKKNK